MRAGNKGSFVRRFRVAESPRATTRFFGSPADTISATTPERGSGVTVTPIRPAAGSTGDAEIREALSVLLEAGQVAELILKTTQRTVSGYFDDTEALVRDAQAWRAAVQGSTSR